MSRQEDAIPMPWWALGAAGSVLGAVGLEVLGGAWANSPTPSRAFVTFAVGIGLGAEWATWH